MAIVINGQTGIDAGHLPISNAGNTEVEGTLTAQGQNVSPFSGFKNYIINGNFDVWQYETSQTSSGYGSDNRWFNYNLGSTKTHSQVACTDVERSLFSSSKFSRTVVSSVAAASYSVHKQQRIEDVTKLAGKKVTLSFWAKADSNKNIAIEFAQIFGIGGTPSSSVTGVGAQKVALTSTWAKYTVTVQMPSIVGKTLGTDGVHTSYTSSYFWFDAGSDYNSRTSSLGQQSGTFDIAQVQLEEGSVATPFENRPYGLELSLCQRYLPVLFADNSHFSGAASSNISAIINIPFLVSTRVPPTGVSISSPTSSYIEIANGSLISTTGMSFIRAGMNSCSLTISVASGLTVGQACSFIPSGSKILFTGCEL